MKRKIIAAAVLVATIIAMSACSSQYYNGTRRKSHPKHTCQMTNDATMPISHTHGA
ncbi:MAG: hypothetical protein MJZ01_01365 [Bacteroidales bacterium]|nr:hypothetical protein [Bacteroidales bacterium]